MNNSDCLTETEKFLFGYIEHIPSEYPPYEDVWDNEELEELETITETPATLEELSEIYEIFGL